jgi:hypothetical protein
MTPKQHYDDLAKQAAKMKKLEDMAHLERERAKYFRERYQREAARVLKMEKTLHQISQHMYDNDYALAASVARGIIDDLRNGVI